MKKCIEKDRPMLAHETVSEACLPGRGMSPTDQDYTRVLDDLQQEVAGRFQTKKRDSEKLAEVYERLAFGSRYLRVADCGSLLEFHVTPQEKKLHRANFCKDRLCPMCNWRRSLKIFGQVSQVMDVLEASDYKFLFLTLTVKNCDAEALPGTVSVLLDGWRKLYHKNKKFRRAVVGSFRSLEVTRNRNTGQFHPHLHGILVVEHGYFTGRNYITQAEFKAMWRECCGLDYDPVVDIRKIRPRPGSQVLEGDVLDGPADVSRFMGLAGAVAEASKYAVKSADFLDGDLDEREAYVLAFLSALTGRRLCGFTGVFDQVRKALALDDAEDGDLVHVDGQQLRDDVGYLVVNYHWRAGVYVTE